MNKHEQVELMEQIFNNYDIPNNYNRITSLVELSTERKNQLKQLLETIPTYDGDRFSNTVSYNPLPDYYEIRDAARNIKYEMIRNIPNYNNDMPRCNLTPQQELYNTIGSIISHICSATIELDDILKRYFENIGLSVRNGQSWSKILNKLFLLAPSFGVPLLKDYNSKYAKLSDMFKSKSLSTEYHVSVRPIDYITMSFGNSWGSCHDMEGCHRAGTLSYMLDECTFIIYGESKQAIYNTEYPTKKFRLVCHVSNNAILYSRAYGSIDENLKKAIIDDFNAKLGFTNLVESHVSPYDYFNSHRYTSHYCDYGSRENRNLFTFDDNGFDLCGTVGHQALCVNCGSDVDETGQMNCDSCHVEMRECDRCGNRHEENEGYWIGDYWYCPDCVISCAHCDDVMVESHGTDTVDGEVCEECLDRHYIQCENCHTYVRDTCTTYDEVNEEMYCNDCHGNIVCDRESDTEDLDIC